MYQIPDSFFEICPKDDRLMIFSVSDVLYTIQTPDSNTNANAGYCINNEHRPVMFRYYKFRNVPSRGAQIAVCSILLNSVYTRSLQSRYLNNIRLIYRASIIIFSRAG